MIVMTKTPLRISFAGGGSDLPAFSNYSEMGRCVNCTIDKFVYVLVKTRDDKKYYLKYSENEIVDNVESIKHELIRNTLKYFFNKHNINSLDIGLEIINFADIPTSGTGLGSSSSFIVGLLHSLSTLFGYNYSSFDLANGASTIEIELCNHKIGFQDQFSVSYGGFNDMIFFGDAYSVTVNKVEYFNAYNLEELSRRILMFYTGIQRKANDILSEQSDQLKVDNKKRMMMRKNVKVASDIIKNLHDIGYDAIGYALRQNWELKKNFNESISNNLIDSMYDVVMKNGALGAKITGAGGGGYMLVYAHKDRHNTIIHETKKIHEDIKYMPVKLVNNGSMVVYHSI